MRDPMELKRHIQNFIQCMQFFGYNRQERVIMYERTRAKYKDIIESNAKGICQLYRRKSLNSTERTSNKKNKANTWYDNAIYQTVMFVDDIHDSELAHILEKTLDEANLRIKERPGARIKPLIYRTYHFDRFPCT